MTAFNGLIFLLLYEGEKAVTFFSQLNSNVVSNQ